MDALRPECRGNACCATAQVITDQRCLLDPQRIQQILNTESDQQHVATAFAEESLQLSQNRYSGGLDTYLQVVIWQTAALTNERNDIDIMRRRLEANVLLIKALGGSWDASQLPKV